MRVVLNAGDSVESLTVDVEDPAGAEDGREIRAGAGHCGAVGRRAQRSCAGRAAQRRVRIEDLRHLKWIDVDVEWMRDRRAIGLVYDLPLLNRVEEHELPDLAVELLMIDLMLAECGAGGERDLLRSLHLSRRDIREEWREGWRGGRQLRGIAGCQRASDVH